MAPIPCTNVEITSLQGPPFTAWVIVYVLWILYPPTATLFLSYLWLLLAGLGARGCQSQGGPHLGSAQEQQRFPPASCLLPSLLHPHRHRDCNRSPHASAVAGRALSLIQTDQGGCSSIWSWVFSAHRHVRVNSRCCKCSKEESELPSWSPNSGHMLLL